MRPALPGKPCGVDGEDLVTDEGVDEGSAASTEETCGPGGGSAGRPDGSSGGGLRDGPDGGAGGGADLARGGPGGVPDGVRDDTDPAPPDGTTVVDPVGQTLEAGEG